MIAPNAVELRYSQIEHGVYVDVYDESTGDLITHDTLGNVADWLRTFRFRWRWGSNGIWERR